MEFDQAFGRDLAALVCADCLTFGQRGGLVRDLARAQSNGGDAAGVNDPLDTRIQRRLHDVAGALNIGGKNFVRIRGPQTIVSSHMKNVARARHCTVDRFAVAQIAFEKLDVQVSEVGVRASLTDERAHRISGLDEFVRDSRADEPACSGDENFFPSVHPSRVPICRGFEPC